MRSIWVRTASALLLALLPVVGVLTSMRAVTAQDTGSAASGLSLPVFGLLEGESEEDYFQGTVSNLVFSEGDGELVLTGLLNGIATIGEDSVRITDQEFETPVEPSVAGAVLPEDNGEDGAEENGEATGEDDEDTAGLTVRTFSYQDNPTQPEPDEGKCDILFLDIQPITLNLLGLEVLTSRITVDVNAIPGEGNLAGNLLCSLAGLLDGLPDTLGQVTDQLNQIVEEAGSALDAAQQDTQGLGALPLFGTFEDENGETGTFQGTVSDLVFSEGDDAPVVDGVLNGITNVGDRTTRIVDEALSSPVIPDVVGSIPADQFRKNRQRTPTQAAPTATTPAQQPDEDNPTLPEPDPDKCDVLFLDIQPITLNLLGLEVLTSRITVDVNAIPGEGNLAGNLVCALAGLLDGTPDAIGQITDQLNQIADEIGVAATDVDAEEAEGTPPTDATDEVVSEEATVEATAETTVAPDPTEAPDGTPVA
jgi:hypothetical protein